MLVLASLDRFPDCSTEAASDILEAWQGYFSGMDAAEKCKTHRTAK